MTQFEILGSTDPFLKVHFSQGESIFAEGGAMAAMDDVIDLTGRARGGMLKSIARAAVTGESFFMQEATAERGPGSMLLAPGYPGEVRVLELDSDSWSLTDGAFLCADHDLEIATRRNKSISASFFGGTGGFFIMTVSGTGKLAVSAIGAIQEMAVPPDGELVVDSGHVVAWPSTLEMKASLTTKQGSGLLGKVVGSVKTGEGVVLRFRGNGRVLVSSRAQPAFIGWLSSRLPGKG
ncbi:MAG: TIGR00266 family protein [Planctomycetota bacterium]|nr:TIGR00266 family protein [Planctomycetota bacterium]MEC8734608.1 TIGR00266 family protein [Planctomycetota bacterium]MEC9158654.1 TIGR00266 family protein [Planctomycetota bacterium]MED6306948.1 TIGR00266 family protein [Planctomycetota bacterium]